jgi:hypothetical protein
MVCQSPISTKKSVSFHENVRVKAALHVNDYSEEEIQATWLNAADMQRIRREIRCTVQLMQWGSSFEEIEYSRRGLEYGTRESGRIRRQNRSEAAKAVLNEQHRQKAGHFVDEQELANVYKVCATSCQITAQLSALSELQFARLLDVECNGALSTKLNPETSFGQTALRGSRLHRIFQRAA